MCSSGLEYILMTQLWNSNAQVCWAACVCVFTILLVELLLYNVPASIEKASCVHTRFWNHIFLLQFHFNVYETTHRCGYELCSLAHFKIDQISFFHSFYCRHFSFHMHAFFFSRRTANYYLFISFVFHIAWRRFCAFFSLCNTENCDCCQFFSRMNDIIIRTLFKIFNYNNRVYLLVLHWTRTATSVYDSVLSLFLNKKIL